MHRIRLREPWVATCESSGEICYQRAFNKPTGLSAGQQIFLKVELLVPCDVTLTINEQFCSWEEQVSLPVAESNDGGQMTGEPRAAAVLVARVDGLLQSKNRIALSIRPHEVLECEQNSPPPIGKTLVQEVAILIHEPDSA